MIEVPLKEDSLGMALRHIEDFAKIHYGTGEYLKPLTILRESLGITTDMQEELTEWCDRFLEEDVAAPVLLGIIVGLIAADHAKT